MMNKLEVVVEFKVQSSKLKDSENVTDQKLKSMCSQVSKKAVSTGCSNSICTKKTAY